MKKKVIIYITILFICIGAIAGIYCFNKTEYSLNLPKENNVSSVALEYSGSKITIETNENITSIINKLANEGRTTKKESIQDSPVNVEDEMVVNFYFDEENSSVVFVYKKNSKYYIEQPYNGIYEITQEEYTDIVKFYQELKVEPMMIEIQNIENRIDKLDPVDQLGKSFKTSDLTNDELLRMGFCLFGPVKNFGFEDITFEDLNRTYINGFFGRDDVQPKDILCSCGKLISTYNRSNDTYTWDKKFHYLDHKSDTYNEIKDIYKVEDRYIVEVYKIFPDLLKHSSTTQYNFYATYNDAANKENPLFTVTNEDEFIKAAETLDDSKKVLYTLTFKRIKGSFKLENYEINN